MEKEIILNYLGKDWNKRLTSKYTPEIAMPFAKAAMDAFIDAVERGNIRLNPLQSCLCGEKDFVCLSAHDRFGLNFKTQLCWHCGLVSTDPVIEEEDMGYYYESIYHPLTFNRDSFSNQDAFFSKEQGLLIWERLFPHFPNKKQIHTLEIGAGTGSVLSGLRDEAQKNNINFKGVGTEFNSNCLPIIRDRGFCAVEGSIQEVKDTFPGVILI